MKKWNKERLLPLPLRKLRDEQGQALIELAITVPMLALLLLGISILAQATYASIEVTNAAMAGVQYGTQSLTTAADITGIQTAAINDAPNVQLQTPNVVTSYACSDGSTPSGSPKACSTGNLETILTVTTQANFAPPFKLPGLPASFTLYGSAVQKVFQ